MKTKYTTVLIFTFLFVFANALFDLTILALFFHSHITLSEWSYFFFSSVLIGGAVVWLYNVTQRLFSFSTTLLLLHLGFLIFTITVHYQLGLTQNYLVFAGMAGMLIPLNIIVILVLKGLITRIVQEGGNRLEKAINIAKYAGILAAGLFLMLAKSATGTFNTSTLIYRSGTIFILSFIASVIMFGNDKRTTVIIDNAQEIKVRHSFFKLLADNYFRIIFLSTALISVLLTFAFMFFMAEISYKYQVADDILPFLSQYAIFISIVSILYEVFLKVRAFYFLGVRNSMLLMPLAMLTLSMLLVFSHYVLRITPSSDFHIFLIIFSFMFMLGTHFSFENLMFPTLNALYSPLDQRNRNDYYTKSCMFGLLAGMGVAAIIYKYILSKSADNQYNIILVILLLIPIVFLVIRYGLYEVYRKKLKESLVNMKVMSSNQNTFIYRFNEHLDTYKGIQVIRGINLSYLINPIISKETCQKLIPSDDNLRQRVGIIKANNLCLLEAKDQLKDLTTTKYFVASPNRDKIEYVLSRFGAIQTRMNKEKYVEQLSISKKNDERVFGAKLCRYADKETNSVIMLRLIKDPILQVVKNVLVSSEGIDNERLIKNVIEKLGSSALANSAYAALLRMNAKYLSTLDDVFYQTGQTEKVQIRIIQLYGDIASEDVIGFLLKKLNYTNQNIIAAALQALSKCSLTLSDDRLVTIKHELNELCQVLIWNLTMISDLRGQKCSDLLLNAMETEIKYNYESLFNLLSLLTDAKTMYLIKSNIQSDDFDKITFALELASIVLKDEMKAIILPLLQPLRYEDKVRKMQEYFPTERMEKREILYNIIQHDYKWINRWTKACALKELANEKNQEDMPVFLANMVNPDPMLAELAAVSAFELNKTVYFDNKEMFGPAFMKKIGKNTFLEIENDTRQSGDEKQMPLLKFDIIKYLRGITEFSLIPGEVLKKLTDHVVPYKFKKGETIENFEYTNDNDYFHIVYSGHVGVYLNNSFFQSVGNNYFLSTLDFLFDNELNISYVAETDVQIFKILTNEFVELLSFYDEIPESVFKNTKTENQKLFEDLLKKRTPRGVKTVLSKFENVQLN
jgi:ATP:ADP antiporter, AAA family